MEPTRILAMMTLTACVALAGCGRGFRTVTISDASQPASFVLGKETGQGHIHYLTVIGDGGIDGAAEISLVGTGTPCETVKTERLSGRIHYSWNTEWYQDTAEIRYVPASVTTGTARLRYRFKDH
jgi:hypothetical protein